MFFIINKLFEDSWIWSEESIVYNYIFDSSLKTEEIYDLIFEKLSDDLIKYPENKAIIKWRSKYLIIKFEDKEDKRIILDLEIK